MESTMKKYAERIAGNQINPHVRCDGGENGLILDPRREDIPLELLGFGVYRLSPDFISRDTGDKEMVLVPQEGEFEAEINGQWFRGARIGGPFAMGPGGSNASALYVPCNARLRIRGQGEAAFFEAPALRDKPPFYRTSGEAAVVSRGEWVWRRDVVSLISPQDASTNLVVGETYSPPGLWSGTPLHSHDRDDQQAGESDHEEIYYHRFHWKGSKKDRFGAHGVQLLMDGGNLMNAYVIGDKSAFAIPGGCHPVVASPVSELLYLWGLAGKGSKLAMKDVEEFAHLKSFESVFHELEGEQAVKILSRERFATLSRPFTEEQAGLLTAILREKGYHIE
jgi:5-deoxy-D-glucuronate isomerase